MRNATKQKQARPLWLRHALLAPYAAEPLGLVIAALFAVGASTTANHAILALVVAAGILIRLLTRHLLRTAVAVGLKTRQRLEFIAAGLAAVALVLAIGMQGGTVALWLVDLAGWRDLRMLSVQILAPGILFGVVVVAGIQRPRRQASPFLQAYLFGHRHEAYAGMYALRVGRVALLVLIAWIYGPGEQAAQAIATVERVHLFEDVPQATERSVAATASERAWTDWTAETPLARLSIADKLPILLSQMESTQVHLVESWLAPVMVEGDRRQFTRQLFEFTAGTVGSAEEPASAVWRGLRSMCATSAGDEGRCRSNASPNHLDLWRFGLDRAGDAQTQISHLVARGRAWHPLLGAWARHHKLCPTTLGDQGWQGQAQTMLMSVVCYGEDAPRHYATVVASAMQANTKDPSKWRVPGRSGTTIALAGRTAGCAKGACLLGRRPSGALRDVRGLVERAQIPPTTLDRWARVSLHLWTLDSELKARWAGLVVLDKEVLPDGNCGSSAEAKHKKTKRRTKAGSRGGGPPTCGARALFGVQLKLAAGETGVQALRVWRISHHVASCEDRRFRGVNCTRPAYEGLQVVRLQLQTGAKGAEQVRTDVPLAELLDGASKRGGHSGQRAARKALAGGQARWLSELIVQDRGHGQSNPTQVILILEGNVRLTLTRGRLSAADRVPVVRFLVAQDVLALAAKQMPEVPHGTHNPAAPEATNKAASAQTMCAAAAARALLVRVAVERVQWHMATVQPTDRWYMKLLGKRPAGALCVLAPVLPYLDSKDAL